MRLDPQPVPAPLLHNGLSASQRLCKEPFELLLTDIVMPEMDGIELARRAAELDPDIKIMFITGFAAVRLHDAKPSMSATTIGSDREKNEQLVLS
jgi:CheY-like chemotaxis protein